MVVRNGVSRYHLCKLAMEFAPRVHPLTPPLFEECDAILTRHDAAIREQLQDLPEVRDWVWSD
jgi:xylulose-5-phosphate/fructose-6-phosphate phosphoketolase